ncbi:MAG: M48 family metalloprotease [Reichenbachiella sp.]
MTNKFYSLIAAAFMILSAVPAQSQSLKFDKKMGAEAAAQVAATMGIYKHDKLTPYVQEVGKRLVDELEDKQFEYQFNIVDEASPNAFALPGGYIYITRGLLALINDVDELGCVLAHEVIHVNRRHSMKQVRRSIFPKLLMLPANLVGVVAGKGTATLLNAPITITSAFFSSKYSRNHETEADDMGIKLAVKAGFNPNALAPILERLIKWEETLTDQKEEKSYFSDHPYTPERVDNLDKQSAGKTWEDNEMHSRPYLDQVDGLIFWENAAKGMFVDNLFLQPEMNFSVQFPEGLDYVNTNSAVGGKNEDENRAIYLALSDSAKTPKTLAKEYTKALKKSKRNAKVKSEKVSVNDNDAYLVTVATQSGGKVVFTHIIWISMNNTNYMIAAESHSESQDAIKETALSLHTLTKDEKAQIVNRNVKVIAANQDETLDDVAMRVDNKMKSKLLYPMNGLPFDTVLMKNQKVKTIGETPYY